MRNKNKYSAPQTAAMPISLGVAVALSSLGYTALSEASNHLILEEVLVVATKREASLQDVSVAVTALPDTVLDQALALSSEDIVALVPSLSLTKGASLRSSSFNIRGIGTQSYSTAIEPSVSTVVDGVVMGRSGQSFMQLLDVQRVEVLRGPQGTLFGKNASGGVVHIISKDPAEEPEGEIVGTLSEGEAYRVGATASGGLMEGLSGRLSLVSSHQDGWIHNYYDGGDRNESDDWSIRGKLLWDATDDLTIRWSSDYYEKDCECSQSTIRSMDPDPNILAEIYPVIPGEENTDVNNNGDLSLEVESYGHSLQLDWQLGEYTLTSITALREWKDEFNEDVDQRPTDPLNFAQGGTLDQEQFTQELRLASPLGDTLNYVVGAFYFNQEVNRTYDRTIFSSTTYSDFTVDTENLALFGEATVNLGDAWRVILGGRYTADDVSYDHQAYSTFNPEVAYLEDETDDDDLSGKLALEWDFNYTSLAYLSYTQGYKGPGFGLGSTTTEPPPPVEPETVDAIELGVKSTLWGGRMTLNAALFYAEYQDWQAEAFVTGDDGLSTLVTTNAGEVSTTGLEVDVTAQLTENLRLFGGVTLIDAEIEEFDNGPCSLGQQYRGECPDRQQDLAGGVLPNSPDWKLNLMLNYTIPTESLPFDWMLAANLAAQDEIQYSVTQDPYTEQDGYEVLDLSAAIHDKAGRYSATLFVKNALDEHYVLGIGATTAIFIPNGYLQQVPRTYERTVGLDVRYRW
jgi:iron complex outermembrane receptor protein